MPVVALPALGVLAAAVLALLALMASGLLTKVVGYLMPNWHIPGYSQLRSAVLNGITSVLDAIGGTLSSSLAYLGNIVAYPLAVLRALLNAGASALAATAATLAWIVHHAIPRAIRALHKVIDHAITAARHYALSLVRTAVHALHHLVQLARHYALSLVHAAVRTLRHLITDARHYAAGLVGALARTVAKDIAHAIAASEAYAAHLVRTIRADLAGVAADIRAAVRTAETYTDKAVASAVRTAEATAAKAAGVLVADLDHAATAAVDAIWSGVTDEVATLEQVIGTDLPRIGAAVRNIPTAIPGDLAEALAGIGALAIPALRYMEDCGIPNCRNLSQFGRDLQGLLGLMGAGALLAMFIELATDPDGGARNVVDTLGTLAADAVDEAKNLIGVG